MPGSVDCRGAPIPTRSADLVCLAPDPPQLPVLRRCRRAAGSRRHGVHRPQRSGQDQPGRGDRLPVAALLPPCRDRRATGPGRMRPGDRPRGRGEGRPHRCARGRAQPRPGQSGTNQQVDIAEGARPGRPGPDRDVLPRGPHPGQGRPVGPTSLPRRPAGAAHPAAGRHPGRLRPDPQAAQLVAEVGAPRQPPGSSRDTRRSGTHTWPGSEQSCWTSGCAWSRSCGPTSAGPTRPSPAAPPATTRRSTTGPRFRRSPT